MLLFTLFLGLNVIYVIAEPPRVRLWLWDIDARRFGYDVSIIENEEMIFAVNAIYAIA